MIMRAQAATQIKPKPISYDDAMWRSVLIHSGVTIDEVPLPDFMPFEDKTDELAAYQRKRIDCILNYLPLEQVIAYCNRNKIKAREQMRPHHA